MKRLARRIAYGFKRLVFKLSPALAARWHIDFRLRAPSREFLERQIFGYVNAAAQRGELEGKLLFVGLDKHNWHYPRLLAPEFHSIDIERGNAVYGPPGRHIVGSALDISRYYEPESFDVVIANGLIGFGLDTEADFDRLMRECHTVLACGGVLVLGYNDRPERTPFRIQRTRGYALFEEFVPPIEGVQGAHHRVDDHFAHRYAFLRKTGPARGRDRRGQRAG